MDDPMKEFKAVVEYWDLNITGSMVHGAVHAKLDVFIGMLSKAIENYEKAHTEQNKPLSIDFGEPLPEMLKKQCGFGDEDE